jgi:hypothetical protein
LAGLPRSVAAERVRYVLERLEVLPKAREFSWNWSAGERQKFSLAMTFIVPTSEQAASGWLAEHAHDGVVIPAAEMVSRLRMLPGNVAPRC